MMMDAIADLTLIACLLTVFHLSVLPTAHLRLMDNTLTLVSAQ